eukprot:gene8179-biopygen19615
MCVPTVRFPHKRATPQAWLNHLCRWREHKHRAGLWDIRALRQAGLNCPECNLPAQPGWPVPRPHWPLFNWTGSADLWSGSPDVATGCITTPGKSNGGGSAWSNSGVGSQNKSGRRSDP